MATKYWVGKGVAVAQVATGSIDSVDAIPSNETFTVTIGGVAISTAGDTNVGTTAAALVALLNASTHPYFSAVTWTNPSGGTITGTADIAGVPFTAALTQSGGSGTVTDFSDSTASAGPNDWSTAENWSDGSIPANSDTVILRDLDDPILWGIDQNGVTLTKLIVEKSFTGNIGLNKKQFATAVDGGTVNASYAEYRETYLKISATDLWIGINRLGGSPVGPRRIKINTGSNAADIIVFDTNTDPIDSGEHVVRLLANHASTNLFVRNAPGGVGLAVEPGETSTVSTVWCSADGEATNVDLGDGVTLTNWLQRGGTNTLRAAADVTSLYMWGGVLKTEGADYAIDQTFLRSGTLRPNHSNDAGEGQRAFNAVLANGGEIDGRNSAKTRVIGYIHPSGSFTLRGSESLDISQLRIPDGTFNWTLADGIRPTDLFPVKNGDGEYTFTANSEVVVS